MKLADYVDIGGVLALGPQLDLHTGEQFRDGADSIHRTAAAVVFFSIKEATKGLDDEERELYVMFKNRLFNPDGSFQFVNRHWELRRHWDENFWPGQKPYCWRRLSRDAYTHWLAAATMTGNCFIAAAAVRRKKLISGLFFDYHQYANQVYPASHERAVHNKEPFKVKPGALTLFRTWALEIRATMNKKKKNRLWFYDLQMLFGTILWRWKDDDDVNTHLMACICSATVMPTWVSRLNWSILDKKDFHQRWFRYHTYGASIKPLAAMFTLLYRIDEWIKK